MKVLGNTLLAELIRCRNSILNEADVIEEIGRESARLAGATVLKSEKHQFTPQGVSVVVFIAESHIAIHTWPEYDYAAVDIFTCGEKVNPRLALDYIVQKLGAEVSRSLEIKRGLPDSEGDKMIPHK